MSWVLSTATSRYVVSLAPEGRGLVLDAWSDRDVEPWTPPARLLFETAADVEPLEYAALGTRHTQTVDLVVDAGDGQSGVRLVWSDAVELVESDCVTRLSATATDAVERLSVRLVIETDRQHDVVRKWVTVRNISDRQLSLPRAFGPAWELPIGPGARIDYLAGQWSREFTPMTLTLPAGELSFGSRTGTTSHRYSPVVTVAPAADQTAAYGVALAWSGSWRMSVDAVPFSPRVRVSAGVDDESGVVVLDPGEDFTSPETLGVFAPDGAGGVGRRWHDYQRSVLARDLAEDYRPIVYNSWYATYFDVTVEHQTVLADLAAGLGVEVFVVDDGWFRGRHDDHAGLGDWTPDAGKFPAGLDPLITAVQERGMRFGLWVEPEAVNPDSDLYRAHPDWIYSAPGREPVQARNQYVLDFGRPDGS